jgi:hypothetical protein
MSATITWSIQSLKTFTQTINGFSEVVTEACWNCHGIENNQTTTSNGIPIIGISNISGTATFVPPQSGDIGFIPYNQLTQDQILGWVWSNGVNKASIETNIQSDIDQQINPTTTISTLPWQS